jgi:hypothetical protein
VAPVREAVRRVDWRFLLDDAQLRTIVALDGPDNRLLIEGVRQLGATVHDVDFTDADGGSVVFVRDPNDDDVDRALARRGGAGTVVIETTSRRARRDVDKCLRRTGLRVRHYGCWPTCANATRFVPLDSRSELIASARAAKNRRRRAVGTVLTRLGLGSLLFSQSTSVVTATDRPHVAAPLRVAFIDDKEPRGTMTLLTPRFGSSRHIIAMITSESGRLLVVKTPRIPSDDDQLSLEARGLTSISGSRPVRPELVEDLERFGQRWLVQTRLSGVPLTRRHVARHPERWMVAAQSWLQEMPSGGRSKPDDDGRSERLISPSLDVLRTHSDREPELCPLLADAELAFAHVRSTPLPVVAEHGDFRPPNLIITGRDAIGAVDWELAERCGLPLYDLLFFHAFVDEVVPGLRPTLRRAAIEVLRSHGLDSDLLEPLSTLAHLRQLGNLVARGTGTVASEEPRVAQSDVARAWLAELHDRRSVDGPEVAAP